MASTGASEKRLRQLGRPHEKIYLHPGHNAGYFPGAKPIDLKLIFSPADGRILGAQAVGEEGVEKRIDVISMAIQKGATVYDLEEAALCYAPQFGAAKDPVNIAGMIAGNVLRGDAPVDHWGGLEREKYFLLDVRTPEEFLRGHVAGGANIPLNDLRGRLKELPCGKKIAVYCQVGQRGYYATRILRLNGFDAVNLSGGYQSAAGAAGAGY